jgi:tetratricopeptide (TPR) repeat protein
MNRRLLLAAVVVLGLVGAARGDDTVAQASQLLGEGKAQQAIDLLVPVVQADPKNSGATLVLGEAYLAADRADQAEAMGRAYIELAGKKPDGYLLATRALVKQGRLPDAYTVIRKGVRSVKKNPLILSELGYVHLAADSIDQAIISLSEAKDIDPKSAVAYRGLGEAYLKLNANGVAILQFEESLRADSTQTDLKYQLARMYYKERRFNDAAALYTSIITLNPSEDAASRELGLMLHLARQYSSAAKVLEPYVQRHPDDLEAWKSYMEALQQSRQYEGAVAAAEHVLSQDAQSPQAHRSAAKSDYMLKIYDKSIYHYGELEKVDSLTAEDTRFFAKAYHDAGNDSSAAVYFRRSIAQDSTQAEVYADMGAAYMKLKQFDLAAAAYERKFMMDSTATSAYVNYALCEEVLGDWKAGREALVKALEQNPNYIPGYYHLGYCLSQMDSTQSARKAYETFVGMADSLQSRYGNDLFSAYRFIAVVYLQDKRYEQAERALQKALALKPSDAELHLWLAQTEHALNKRDEARSEYQKVLKLDPNNKDAKKGLDILELYE